mmetsp:Transcript_146270/g.364769  ORF Transcript_146270/g.364769 Transcript_146270/m.364769 type:complete len:204 (+) Transcript_146270:357-968(+)
MASNATVNCDGSCNSTSTGSGVTDGAAAGAADGDSSGGCVVMKAGRFGVSPAAAGEAGDGAGVVFASAARMMSGQASPRRLQHSLARGGLAMVKIASSPTVLQLLQQKSVCSPGQASDHSAALQSRDVSGFASPAGNAAGACVVLAALVVVEGQPRPKCKQQYTRSPTWTFQGSPPCSQCPQHHSFRSTPHSSVQDSSPIWQS